MATRAPVIAKLDRLIEALSEPLPKAERKNGWDEETRTMFLDFFERLRARLGEDRPLDEGELPASIARLMDHWGISGGELMEQAAEISIDLRSLR